MRQVYPPNLLARRGHKRLLRPCVITYTLEVDKTGATRVAMECKANKTYKKAWIPITLVCLRKRVRVGLTLLQRSSPTCVCASSQIHSHRNLSAQSPMLATYSAQTPCKSYRSGAKLALVIDQLSASRRVSEGVTPVFPGSERTKVIWH